MYGHAGPGGILKVLGIEKAQNSLPFSFLRLAPGSRLCLVEDLPMQSLGLPVTGIIASTLLGTAQDAICLAQLDEQFGVSGVHIVWMIALGQHPVDTLNRLGVSVRTQLHDFVAVQFLRISGQRLAAG